jgi:hypothetical protein
MSVKDNLSINQLPKANQVNLEDKKNLDSLKNDLLVNEDNGKAKMDFIGKLRVRPTSDVKHDYEESDCNNSRLNNYDNMPFKLEKNPSDFFNSNKFEKNSSNEFINNQIFNNRISYIVDSMNMLLKLFR